MVEEGRYSSLIKRKSINQHRRRGVCLARRRHYRKKRNHQINKVKRLSSYQCGIRRSASSSRQMTGKSVMRYVAGIDRGGEDIISSAYRQRKIIINDASGVNRNACASVVTAATHHTRACAPTTSFLTPACAPRRCDAAHLRLRIGRRNVTVATGMEC